MIPSNLEGEFTFESDKGREVKDSCFNVLFVGDWSGDGVKREMSTRKAWSIDRDDFDEVLRRFAPRVTIGEGEGRIDIEFGSIDDFHPDELYRRLPIFAELRDLRRELKSADSFNRAAGRVRSWLPSESVQDPPVTSGDVLEDILGGAAATRESKSPLDVFISRIVAPHVVGVDEDEQSRLVAIVDKAISESMRVILHNPGFVELEAAWRGLYFVVRRFETDSNHKLFVFDLSKQEFCDDLRSVGQLADSVLAGAIAAEHDIGMIAANYRFGPEVDDVAALIRASQIGAAFGSPFISFFDHPCVRGGDFEEKGEKLWTALRASDSAAFLGLSPMRVLARVPYGVRSEPIDTFDFEEIPGEPEPEQMCWCNPAFAIALLTAAGERDGAVYVELKRLPFFSFESDGEATSMACAEFSISEKVLQSILNQGLIAVVGYRDEDRAVVPRFQSVSIRTPSLGARR